VPDVGELLRDALERERRLQREVLGRALEPLDRTFDLFEQSAAMLHEQAEAIERAGAALQQAAGLMKVQAELFQATVRALREPSRRVESALGVGKEPRKKR
jgi:hypothetical protein